MNNLQPPREEIIVCAVALLVACLLAANQVTGGGVIGWLGSYAYWIARVAIEASLFFMALVAIEKYASNRLQEVWVFVLAFGISLIPFTLAITSFDLIVGLPELGLNTAQGQSSASLSVFAKELVYLSDNHLVLCAILILPKYWLKQFDGRTTDKIATGNNDNFSKPASFLDALDPPLNGRILWIEAQEHYIKVNTESESRMLLHRFADAIRELPASTGMQVHRSHWVSFADIKALKREGQRLRLLLRSGDYVPVSRSYRQQLEEKFQTLNGKTGS